MAGLFGTPSTTTPSTISTPGITQDLANDTTLTNPPDDSISDIAFSPQADFLSVASWDNKVRIYEVTPQGQSKGLAMFEHQGPVLSTRWSPDGTKVVGAGCDNTVRLFDLQSNTPSQVAQHDQPIRSVRFVDIPNTNSPMIATASWDKTLKYWDLRQPQPVSSVQLPERAYTMDASKSLLVVGTAERHICIVDLNNPGTIFRTSPSPLKWQTRVISCFTTGEGYAVGSIEGRCGIQYVDLKVNQANSFSFKCHRRPLTTPRQETLVYALNSISLHPIYGTLSTAGSDGSFHFWDKDSKHRLKGFSEAGGPITSTAFNKSGSIFAYAISYDWSKGYANNTPQFPTMVKFHPASDEEIKPRPRKVN